MRNPLFKKADPLHPEHGFYRPQRRITPAGQPLAEPDKPEPKASTPSFDEVHYIHYPDDNTFNVVLFERNAGVWSKVVDEAELDGIVGRDIAQMIRRGEGQDQYPPNTSGIEVPFKSLTVHSKSMTPEDDQFLHDLRISGHLRKKVRAAYMNGCASHAMQWLASHHGIRGSDVYAKKNGLQAVAFKDAIRSMSRFASVRRKLAGTTCAKCGLPFRNDEMTSRTADGIESHLACPHTASKTKKAAQYMDDEWRRMLEARGYVPQTLFQGKRESELWSSTQEADTEVQIDHDANDDPYYEVYVSDQMLLKGCDSQELKEFLQAGDGSLEPFEPPVQHERELNDMDKKLFGITGKQAGAHASDNSPYQEINDPVCLCGHTFHDHERYCDHCEECPGFTPASMPQQVEYLCEHRSFGRVGTKPNPMTFERSKNERMLKVYFEGDRVSKAEFLEKKGDKPETREGWDGFFSFTQAFGD